MSIRLPPVSLAGAVVGIPIAATWQAVARPPTLNQIAAGRKSHLELFNASSHTLMVNIVDTGHTFTLYPKAVQRVAAPEPARSVTFTPDYVMTTTGLNSVLITYYGPAESQEEWTSLATPEGNGAATSINQPLVANVTWSPGSLFNVTLSMSPTLPNRTPYLTELIIFHASPSGTGVLGAKDYAIIGKSYSFNLRNGGATIITIGANYERPGVLPITFPTAYTFPGSTGLAITCGIIAISGGNFVYGGGLTMIGYEL